MKDDQEIQSIDASYDWPSQSPITAIMKSLSPCAIVDQSGVITSANAAFAALAPHSTGRPLHDTFFFRAPAAEEIPSVSMQPEPQAVLYYDASGMLIPAWLHTLYDVPGTSERMILLADGSPFRLASQRQLNAAPLAVLRVCAEGIVRFANTETFRALSLTPEDVIGHTLESLFGETANDDGEQPKHFGQRLEKCFNDCLTTLEPVAFDVSVAQYTNGESETAEMRLIPDLAPDGRALGVLAVIGLTLEERIRAQIGKISRDTSATWQERLGLVLEQVKRLIDFQHANFGMYAEDASLFRAFALYPPDDRFNWKERWLALPPGMKQWAESRKTFVPDIGVFLKDFPELRENEVVRMYRALGIRSSVTLVAKDGKGPTSALSLCSSTPSKYTQRDVEVLRDLNLEPVLIRIEEQILEQRIKTADSLRRSLSKAKDLSKAACYVVNKLAKTFGFEYVSLYRVDRQNGQFELVHENKCPQEFHIAKGYTQELRAGMLGECLKRQKTLVVNDVGNEEVEQYHYIGLGRDVVRSAMTIPLRLNERIRWMLHIEAREAQAFLGPDRESIKKVVKLLEDGVQQRAMLEVNRRIMTETRQGVVVVGLEGMILSVNEAASRLLGLKRAQKPAHSYLSNYTSEDNEAARDILSGLVPTERRRVELKGEDGQIRPVLATRRVLEGSFDTAIWFLIDLQSREWEIGMRFLRATAADVAQQTRAPLALASNIVRQLPGAPQNFEALSNRLLAEIKKADITFERLAKSYDIRRYPMRHALSRRINLAAIAFDVRAELPARDRTFVEIRPNSTSSDIKGDVERMEFVIRSLMAHLLRVRSDEQHVIVSFASGDALVRMSVELTNADSVPAVSDDIGSHDVMKRASWIAREDAGIGLQAINRVVKAHGGSMETIAATRGNDDTTPPLVEFRITLPQLTGESRP